MQVHIRSKGAKSGVGAAWRALRVVEGIGVPALQGCAALQRRLLLHGRPEALHPCMMLQLLYTRQMMRKQHLVRYHSDYTQPGAPPGLQRVLMPQRFEELQRLSMILCCTELLKLFRQTETSEPALNLTSVQEMSDRSLMMDWVEADSL